MNDQMLEKCRDAATGGWDAVSVMSTGERLAAALVCNRCDWLQKMDYTIPEAINRLGEWSQDVPVVATALEAEGLLPMTA